MKNIIIKINEMVMDKNDLIRNFKIGEPYSEIVVNHILINDDFLSLYLYQKNGEVFLGDLGDMYIDIINEGKNFEQLLSGFENNFIRDEFCLKINVNKDNLIDAIKTFCKFADKIKND